MLHFKFNLIFVICVLLLCLGVFAQDSKSQDKNGTIHGYITDTTPAQLPINDVRIEIDNMKGHVFLTESAETGEFIYRDIPEDEYVINFRKAGYHSRKGLPISVISGKNRYVPITMNKKGNGGTGFQNLFSSKEPQGGTLLFEISTQISGTAPIENAEIFVKFIRSIYRQSGSEKNNNKDKQQSNDESDDIEIMGKTNAYGEYRHDNLTPGIYIVAIGKEGYHTASISVTIEENRITTAHIQLSISDDTTDTDVVPSEEIDIKRVIRGKIVETNFEQTPVSDVEVEIKGVNADSEESQSTSSNADGEYEFVLPPGDYIIFVYKEGYVITVSLVEVTADSRESTVTVLKENMFVVYEEIVKGNELTLKHGISKRQKSFGEKSGDWIRLTVLFIIIGVIFVRFLMKRRQKYSQE